MLEPLDLTLRANPNALRGCGDSRIQGGVYLECGVGPNGLPLETFVYDPPIPYTSRNARGVFLENVAGVTHVIDEVSYESYPYPSDIIEEVRKHGLSRKVSPDVISSALTPESRIMLVHRRGILANAKAFKTCFDEERLAGRCNLFSLHSRRDHLDDPSAPCTRHTYALAAKGDNPVRRFTGSTCYSVVPFKQPAKREPSYSSAIIASFPITFISVIQADNGSHVQAMEKIKSLEIPKAVSVA
jgi:hypothetical protein